VLSHKARSCNSIEYGFTIAQTTHGNGFTNYEVLPVQSDSGLDFFWWSSEDLIDPSTWWAPYYENYQIQEWLQNPNWYSGQVVKMINPGTTDYRNTNGTIVDLVNDNPDSPDNFIYGIHKTLGPWNAGSFIQANYNMTLEYPSTQARS
jgi:hypothetical protein